MITYKSLQLDLYFSMLRKKNALSIPQQWLMKNISLYINNLQWIIIIILLSRFIEERMYN